MSVCARVRVQPLRLWRRWWGALAVLGVTARAGCKTRDGISACGQGSTSIMEDHAAAIMHMVEATD